MIEVDQNALREHWRCVGFFFLHITQNVENRAPSPSPEIRQWFGYFNIRRSLTLLGYHCVPAVNDSTIDGSTARRCRKTNQIHFLLVVILLVVILLVVILLVVILLVVILLVVILLVVILLVVILLVVILLVVILLVVILLVVILLVVISNRRVWSRYPYRRVVNKAWRGNYQLVILDSGGGRGKQSIKFTPLPANWFQIL